MKKLLVLPLLFAGAVMLMAQQPPLTPQASNGAPPPPPRDPPFTPFKINFLGGQPAKLVQMITNETHKPLNVIIPPEFADTELPPLNLSSVTIPQLFEALEVSSKRTVSYFTGSSVPGGMQQYQRGINSFGFKTTGMPREDSIWYFFVENTTQPPKSPPPPEPKEPTVCRFFQLAPYLDRGLKVEDITTALDAAWKMMGDKATPQFKFHQDTKLLIAVGRPDKLLLIDDMLAHLEPVPIAIDPATGLPANQVSPNVTPPERKNPKPAKP